MGSSFSCCWLHARLYHFIGWRFFLFWQTPFFISFSTFPPLFLISPALYPTDLFVASEPPRLADQCFYATEISPKNGFQALMLWSDRWGSSSGRKFMPKCILRLQKIRWENFSSFTRPNVSPNKKNPSFSGGDFVCESWPLFFLSSKIAICSVG